MTINVTNLQRIRFEEESSFCTEMTIGNFKDVPFVEGSAALTLEQAMESPGHAQQYIDGHPTRVNLPKRGKLDITVPLATVDTKASNGVTIAQSPLGEMLKVAMGGEVLGQGTTVNDASPSTTTNTLTDAAGFYSSGNIAIAMPTGSNGELECRGIKTKSGNDVTPKNAFSNAPSNGGTAYASATYYLTGQTGSDALSGQFAVEGIYTEDAWLLKGGQISSMRFQLPNGGLPKVAFSWQFADWKYADGTNTTMDLTAASIVAATYTNTKSIVQADSEFRVGTVGSTTIGTLYQPSEITFEPNIVYAPQISPGGTNNIVQWIRLHQAPACSGSFVIPYEATTFRTSKDTPTFHSITFQIGTSATDGAIYLAAHNVQIVDVQPVDAGGIRSQRVSWVARHDTDFTGSTSALERSALKVHFF